MGASNKHSDFTRISRFNELISGTNYRARDKRVPTRTNSERLEIVAAPHRYKCFNDAGLVPAKSFKTDLPDLLQPKIPTLPLLFNPSHSRVL